jgi:hypothetical protein
MQIIRINRAPCWRGALLLLLAALCAWMACEQAGAQNDSRSLHIDARVGQHGSQSGITNTLFSTWLPPGAAFGGLEGQISLSGTGSGFSEALVLLGTTQDGPSGCRRRDRTTADAVPALSRLWAAILKNNGAATVTLPVSFSLPHPVPAPAQGACMITVISAGYPYLDRATARYTTTIAQLNVAAAPSGAPVATVLPVGLGGEFRIPSGSAPLATLVGIRAARTLLLDAISESLSAAPVAGAPAGSPWLPVPPGAWAVSAVLVYVPAPICASRHFAAQPGNRVLAMLREVAPLPRKPPEGSVTLTHMTLPSPGTTAAQSVGFQIFPDARASSFTGALAQGDCLILYDSAGSKGSGQGILDVENQSTIYLRPVP